VAGGEQARRADASGVVEAPGRAEWLIQPEEVAQAGRVAATNDLWRNVVTATGYPLGHAPHRRLGIRQPQEHQRDVIALGAAGPQPGSERATRHRGLEGEGLTPAHQLIETRQHQATSDRHGLGAERREPLVVAIIALVIGGLAANALGRLVRGATAESGLGNPDLLGSIARVAVWAFAIVIAVNQIGIATTLINTLFMATVGAVALALGLAFGLGGRETAAMIVRDWYTQGRQAAPKMQQAADSFQRKAEDQAESAVATARSSRSSDSTPTSANRA
jgi:hypothetical protein